MKKYTDEEVVKIETYARIMRKEAINMIYTAKAGHPGASLSQAEIVASLYFKVMNVDPKKPKEHSRDRFILSKGHASPSLYAALALRGFFSMDELPKFRQFNSLTTAYPDTRTPGIDMGAGSLGHGLSAGAGMAKMSKLEKLDNKIYCVLGDGELQEGSVWEAVMFASHHKLDNLIAIVDWNKLQINGSVEDVIGLSPLQEKWAAFGWNVIVIDGHNVKEVLDALYTRFDNEKPTVILANTIKGKGVSFMENNYRWHMGVPTEKEYLQCMKELEVEDACNE